MSYIGQGLPADTFQGFTTDKFTGDGTANKAFTLTKEPFSEDTILVTIDGVVQEPTDDFTVSGTTLTLVGTAANGSEVNVTHMGGPLPIGGAAELDLNGASDKLVLDADGDTTISADTDDQIDFKLGGTDFMSLTATGATITTADNSDTLTLISTDADANTGPNLKLTRNSSSPADGDVTGEISFVAENDNDEAITYSQISSRIDDASDGTEDGRLFFYTMVGGSSTERLRFNGTETAFNEGSADLDFRVESDGNANMLLVDAGNNVVRVGSSSHTNSLIANNHELVVGDESSGASGIAIVAPNNENSYVSFFDPDNSGSFRGSFNYNHTSDFLRTYVGGTETLRLQAGNAITMDVSSGATTDTTAALQLDKEDESASASSRMIGFIVGGQGRGFILNGTSDSGSPSFGAGSDRRLKKNITAYTGGYDKIKAIPVQTWDEQFTDATGVKGWIADELEKVFPEAVTGTKDGTKTVTNAIISEHGNCLKENVTEEEFNELQAKEKYANCTWSASKVVPAFQMSSSLQFFPDVVQALQAAITKIETLETKVKALEDA